MQIYFAPLEGITGFAYRNVHRQFFGEAVDKYFSPFAAPNYTHHFKTREQEDIDPANNKDVVLVPQILTNRAGDFLWAAREMAGMGYREINLNLGCPMPTVVKKGRGSGQLGDPDALDRFLEEICEGMDREFGLVTAYSDDSTINGHTLSEKICETVAKPSDSTAMPSNFTTKPSNSTAKPSGSAAKPSDTAAMLSGSAEKTITFSEKNPTFSEKNGVSIGKSSDSSGKIRFSVKTRIGLETAEHAGELLDIYNRYPIAELVVHPRTQRDLYGGKPDLETFSLFLEGSRHPVVYNGDIFTVSDHEKICARFPKCRAVMLGRGLIANPALARELTGGAPLQKEELRRFHDAVYEALKETLPGQAPLLGKMKELWFYMGRNFRDADRLLKDIKKAKNEIQYRAAVRTLFVCGDF